MSPDLYTRLTAIILAQLEAADPAAWSPHWHGADPLPVNARIGSCYYGLITLSRWFAAQARSYTDPSWATYQQWAVLVAQVRRGEEGSLVLFCRALPERVGEGVGSRDHVADKLCARFVTRTAHVFNAAQVEGAPIPEFQGPASVGTDPSLDHHAFVRATGATIEVGGARAAYMPVTDTIRLLSRAVFHSGAAYATTLNRELVHSTGALHCLACELTRRLSSRAYAAEERVAELGAALVLVDPGLVRTPHPDHAAYCADGLPLLRAELRALAMAASHAARADAYLRARCHERHGAICGTRAAA